MNQSESFGQTWSTIVNGQELSLSTGELAKQADGAVVVRYGETIVLGTATMGRPLYPDADFLPLLVEFEEKFYAAGKIKGSRFIKREGRPNDEAILTARLIDRSLRPLFPHGMINDVQVVLTVLSYDGQNDPDIAGMVAAFAALSISGIPWDGPLSAVRVGRVNNELVVNPTVVQRETSTLDLIVAGSADRIVMLEAGAHEISEEVMLDAMEAAQQAMGPIAALIAEMKKEVGKPVREVIMMKKDPVAEERITALAKGVLIQQLEAAQTKEEIGQVERTVVAHVLSQLSDEEKEAIPEKTLRGIIHELHGAVARDRVMQSDQRSDKRALDEVRALSIRAGILPRAHGSGLFQRGQTQILTVLTLGGPSDVLLLDTMEIEAKKHYIHYYNFPAFSVGEIRPNRGPGRREIGHGALAERALLPVLPERANWPYTMLLVSEVLESHGSSSMGSVCGSSLALMQAGVPIKKAVAGIAMGLVTDGQGNFKVLTDIAGIEDEKGDMDFKVAGTKDGITAMQMDIKVTGLNREILSNALEQARKARLHIMEAMNAVISEPNSEMSPYAPRIYTMRVPVEKIGDLIGPKGKHINEIIEQTGVEIDIEDDGLVSITSNDGEAMEKAKQWVLNMTREIAVGERFEGRVSRIMDFGAFVELLPNVDGMVHISQFRDERIDNINDVVKVGDSISVVVVEIDSMGRINLSYKAALPGAAPYTPTSRPSAGPRSNFRGPRPPRR